VREAPPDPRRYIGGAAATHGTGGPVLRDRHSFDSVVREPTVPSPDPPLLVLLHGVGADELDLLPVADALDPRLLAVSLRAPYEAEPMGYAWYALDWRTTPPTPRVDQAEASRAALAAFLPELAARSGGDPERVFLFGFSQGAAMALAVALTRPELLRGAVIHSARALPFLAEPERRAEPAALARLDALVLHGTEDDVIPVSAGREVRALLAPLLGERLTYREHDAGHFVTAESARDAARWIRARIA
jgi:phospholipase/carboxylesterase